MQQTNRPLWIHVPPFGPQGLQAPNGPNEQREFKSNADLLYNTHIQIPGAMRIELDAPFPYACFGICSSMSRSQGL